jgi:hypothetical protein
VKPLIAASVSIAVDVGRHVDAADAGKLYGTIKPLGMSVKMSEPIPRQMF